MGDPARVLLHWNRGPTVIRSVEIENRPVVTLDHGARSVRFPDLQKALEEEWRAAGVHRGASDPAFDEIVLHTADAAPYSEIVGAMDAAYGVKRPGGGRTARSAFRVVFAER
jgi:hypothetical protein